ncbi:hypothetical protein P3S68_032468 [Capsicum galapagoense]
MDTRAYKFWEPENIRDYSFVIDLHICNYCILLVKRISEVAQGSKILAAHTDSPGEASSFLCNIYKSQSTVLCRRFSTLEVTNHLKNPGYMEVFCMTSSMEVIFITLQFLQEPFNSVLQKI